VYKAPEPLTVTLETAEVPTSSIFVELNPILPLKLLLTSNPLCRGSNGDSLVPILASGVTVVKNATAAISLSTYNLFVR